MNNRADISVYDASGRLQLIVEVKSKRAASKEWVEQMHRNLLVHGLLPNAPYFLLVLPDYCHLWANGFSFDSLSPDYTIETAKVLAPYVDKMTWPLGEISEWSLELLVSAKFDDIVKLRTPIAELDADQFWLTRSGLYDVIKNGSVAVDTPV